MATETSKMDSPGFVHLLAILCGSLVNAWSTGYAILELGESTGAEFLPISVGILVDHEEREDNLEIIRRELLQPHVPQQPQPSLSRHRLHQRPFRRRHHRQLQQFRPKPLEREVPYGPRSLLTGAGRLLADGYDDDDDEDGEDDDEEEEEDDDFIAFHLARTFFNDSYSVSTAICKMLKSGMTILIGSHSPRTLNTIKSYSDAFNIPYLSTGPAHNISRKGETFQLFMRPHVVLALRDLIRFKGWKNIHYMYDNEAALERLQQLMELIQDGEDRVSVETRMLDKKSELITNLSSIFHSDFLTQGRKKIFLDLSHDLLVALLTKMTCS